MHTIFWKTHFKVQLSQFTSANVAASLAVLFHPDFVSSAFSFSGPDVAGVKLILTA